MARDVCITYTVHWQVEPGDGTACAVCGDSCWLGQWRLVMHSSRGDFADSGWVMCAACHDG